LTPVTSPSLVPPAIALVRLAPTYATRRAPLFTHTLPCLSLLTAPSPTAPIFDPPYACLYAVPGQERHLQRRLRRTRFRRGPRAQLGRQGDGVWRPRVRRLLGRDRPVHEEGEGRRGCIGIQQWGGFRMGWTSRWRKGEQRGARRNGGAEWGFGRAGSILLNCCTTQLTCSSSGASPKLKERGLGKVGGGRIQARQFKRKLCLFIVHPSRVGYDCSPTATPTAHALPQTALVTLLPLPSASAAASASSSTSTSL